jgi:glucokinase
MNHFLGIDIGASTVKLGLLAADGAVVGRRRDFDSQAAHGPDATKQVVAEAVPELMAENGLAGKLPVAIGACSPTPVSPDGFCVYPTNIGTAWEGVNVREMLSDALGAPAYLLNDGDAAAYREFAVRSALGRGSDGMVQFITGTGLGGSIIVNGEVFAGPGVTAELGHVVTDTSAQADRCGCGALGCVETRASLMGLANIVRRRSAAGSVPETLQGEPSVVARRLRGLGQGDAPDPVVSEIWREYFTHIGRAARTVANTVGCDLIVLSGGAQERDSSATEAGWHRFLEMGLSVVTGELHQSFPHLRRVRVEWAIDELPDSAAYGAAAWAAHQASR